MPTEINIRIGAQSVNISEKDSTRNKQAKVIYFLLLILKNVCGFSQADLARVIQHVHDKVLSGEKFDTKLQKDCFNDVCADANRIAKEQRWKNEWLAKEMIYHVLMAK